MHLLLIRWRIQRLILLNAAFTEIINNSRNHSLKGTVRNFSGTVTPKLPLSLNPHALTPTTTNYWTYDCFYRQIFCSSRQTWRAAYNHVVLFTSHEVCVHVPCLLLCFFRVFVVALQHHSQLWHMYYSVFSDFVLIWLKGAWVPEVTGRSQASCLIIRGLVGLCLLWQKDFNICLSLSRGVVRVNSAVLVALLYLHGRVWKCHSGQIQWCFLLLMRNVNEINADRKQTLFFSCLVSIISRQLPASELSDCTDRQKCWERDYKGI